MVPFGSAVKALIGKRPDLQPKGPPRAFRPDIASKGSRFQHGMLILATGTAMKRFCFLPVTDPTRGDWYHRAWSLR